MYKNIGNYEEVLKELYPYNLYFKSICSSDVGDYRVIDPEKLICAIGTLTDREKAVIKHRYELCETYEQVGQFFGVTRERIRQIEAKALRKLRHPERRRKYEYREDPQSSNQAVSNVRDLISHICHEGMAEERPDNKQETTRDPRVLQLKDLEMSVRAFNSLTRAGYRTLGDIVDAGEEKLAQVRNFGRRSLIEVSELLNTYGLELETQMDI